MPPFQGHHCPICSRIGDKRCITHGHFGLCSQHPDTFHARREACVKCVAASRREDRAARQVRAEAKDKENTPLDGHDKRKPSDCNASNQAPLACKKPKAKPKKPETPKSIKQLRREKKAAKAAKREVT